MVTADVRLVLYVSAGLLVALGLFAGALRVFAIDVRAVLTRSEWIVLLKLLATILMFSALLVRTIYVGLPAENFIYGRF